MTVDVLRYRSGEVIEVGDRVMEPVNGMRMGTVVEVWQPGTEQAAATGYPGGGISVEWDDDHAWILYPPENITEPYVLFFLGRRP